MQFAAIRHGFEEEIISLAGGPVPDVEWLSQFHVFLGVVSALSAALRWMAVQKTHRRDTEDARMAQRISN